MEKIIAFFMTVLIAFCSFFGLPVEKIYERRKLDINKLQESLVASVNSNIEQGKVGGVEMLITKDNNVVYNEVFGNKSVNGDTLEKNAMFRIASMTKPVTAVALLLEAEKGHIDIYADVADYIPGFADMDLGKLENGEIVVTGKAKNSVKVYQLVSHSSGIASGDLEDKYYEIIRKKNPQFTVTDVVDVLPELPLMYDPGTSQAYSTIAFDVAARIVELTSGQDFEEYVKENIFEPLGMNDTTFHPTSEQWDRMVTMHNRNSDGVAFDQQMNDGSVFGSFPSTYIAPGAGLASTASDYAKFAQMLLNNGKAADGTVVMSEHSVELMRTPCVSKKIMPGDARWGLGVIVYVKNTENLPKGSFGWSGAYGTHFFIDPVDKLTAVYMKNSYYDGGAGANTSMQFESDIMNSFVWQ